MTTATFDTFATARKLEEAGLDTTQVEAVTEAIRAAVTQGVATKADLEQLRADLTWRMVLVVGALLALATAVDRLLG